MVIFRHHCLWPGALSAKVARRGPISSPVRQIRPAAGCAPGDGGPGWTNLVPTERVRSRPIGEMLRYRQVSEVTRYRHV